MIARLGDARRRGEDDGGFALIFVLLVTTMVMLGVAAALAAVTPNITGARRSQDAIAARTAARSGVDDLIAYLTSIPSCRSETRVCPAALNASSTAMNGTARQRPTLGTSQSFTWRTNPAVTSDGYVRVTSTGTSNGVSRTLVADLSLRPSILAYGYYTDYESLSPSFLTGYVNARNIYLSDSNIFDYVNSSASVPRYANWGGAKNADNCGQHWYAEPGSTGRSATAGSSDVTQNSDKWYEPGSLASTKSLSSGTSLTRGGGCDLVFTSAMVEDGMTYSRDAFYSSGDGPTFNQPVYTMWGYNDRASKNYTVPGFPAAGQNYRGDPIKSSPNKPQVAADDLRLPASIGTDAIPEESCVYYGPTRVKLNGDGSATVTSPYTRTKPPAPTDPACYPANVSSGVISWRIDYRTVGSGAIVVRNLGSVPSNGWPSTSVKSTSTPSASNEVFYLASGADQTDVAVEPDRSVAKGRGCETGLGYSASVSAACAWTDVASPTDGNTGWTTYSKTTCSSAAKTNRQLFECEYGNVAGTASPSLDQSGGQYGVLRTAVQKGLDSASCTTGASGTQATCVANVVNTALARANTGQHPATYASPASGDRRYFATATAGSQASAVTVNGSGTYYPSTAGGFLNQKATVTRLPITVTVNRQTFASNAWGNAVSAFRFTTTQYDYTSAGGASYFPNPSDVTEYNTGTSATQQPGDLYVDGGNTGKLSVVADNDVVVTGDITNPVGSSPDTSAVSIAAGKDVRNYHPTKCTDQDTTDIGNTTAGWCPNDITGLSLSTNTIGSDGDFVYSHPTQQYQNLQASGDRTIEAAVFAVAGSFRTDNYDRADWVGNLNVHGGIYQSARGGNGVVYNGTANSGTTLQYKYVDLQRAELPYVPPASSGNYSRPWDVVSISAGPS